MFRSGFGGTKRSIVYVFIIMRNIGFKIAICLLFTTMLLDAQNPGEAEFQQYIDRVFLEIWPQCAQQQDQACIFHHADSLIQWGKKRKDWPIVIYFSEWKAHYSDRFNRKDLYYETLYDAENVLSSNKDTLGDLFYEYWFSNQLRWGKYFYDRGDWPHALEKYKQVIESISKQPDKSDEDYSSMANAFTSIGVIYREQGLFGLAQSCFLKSIDFEKQRGLIASNSGLISITYKHLGDLYFKKEDYNRALEYYQNACKIYEKTDTTQAFFRNGLGTTLVGMAMVNQRAGRFAEALSALRAAEIVDAGTGGIDYNLWFHFGELYAAQGNLAQAHHYFNRAFDRRFQVFGLKHYKIAEVFSAYGELAARQNDYACALEHYQSALISLTEGFDETDIRQNPVRFQSTFIHKDIVSVLGRKIETLRRWAAVSENDEYLLSAWATVQAAVQAVDILKTGTLQSEDDKLLFFRQSAQIFEHGIQIAWELGPKFHAAAFELSEKSKAVVLLDAFRNANALRLAGIPDSLLEREAQLKYEISAAEDTRFKGDQSPELRDRLLSLQNEYRALLSHFEQNYAQYYRLRYDHAVISSSDAQQSLRRGQSAVAFFCGTQSLFAFVLHSDGMTMYQLPSGEPIDALVTNMRAGIYDYFLASQRTAAVYESSAAQYVQSASRLYDVLLAPFAAMLPEDVLFIPDGVLGYLPFEALLTAPPPGSVTRFKTHPYLLHRHRISYCYSMTLWQEMQQKPSANRKLAAFAPAFRPAASLQPMALRGALDTLYFNRPEVEEIASVLKQAGAYSGRQAVKSQFMQIAPHAGILHIASHGIANDTASGYSFIAFTSADPSSDSSRLYARELYNLRLNAAMVVLSACETGIGELKKGEGIISLARAFAYAGAQSVVSTLWSVNDESTTHIMRAFYKDIRAGNTKSEALRNAKATYIRHSPEDMAAHPFYWSAYIAVGDMRPLYGARGWLMALGILVLAMTGLGFWRRSRMKAQNQES